LLGCAGNIPRQELQRANQAYEAVVSNSDQLLANLAVAERRNFIVALEDKAVRRQDDVVVPREFAPANAAYLSSIGDPDLTAALRRGLRVTGDYFSTLTLLAEGGNVSEAKAQLTVLAQSVAGLATVATGGTAVPLVAIAQTLGPIVDEWARAESAEELRRLVTEGAPKIDALLQKMQDSATQIYETLKTAPENAAQEELLKNAAGRRAALLQMAEANVMVANYVQLLGGLRDAVRALAAAVRMPRSTATLASLAASSERLLSEAQAASRAVALIRARGTSP
jgi:hypothetical protein